MTAISDPAARTGIGRGRDHGRLRRIARAGWDHPRTRRVRVSTRRGVTTVRRGAGWARTRIRSRSQRVADHLRKRKWALRVRGWGTSVADWWSRLWSAWTGRARDPRYGHLKGWQLGAAAVAIGAVGAGRKQQTARPLVGRIIGTAAPTPGDGGPITMVGRALLALTTGEGERPLAPEVKRVLDASEELKTALSKLGGSDIGMLDYLQGLEKLEEMFTNIAEGIREMGGNTEEEQPVEGGTIEFFGTIESAVRGSGTVAGEMPGLFEAEHEAELKRLRAPRRREEKWDVSQQGV